MQNEGFLRLSRKTFDHFLWQQKRVFSKFEAWIDILSEARYSDNPGERMINNKKIIWNRGQFPASESFLMTRWGWSKSKLRTFLKLLRDEQMVTLNKDQGMNLITVCNYGKYNKRPTSEEPVKNQQETSKEPAKDLNSKKGKKEKKEKKVNLYRKIQHLDFSVEDNEKLLSEGNSQTDIDSILDAMENNKNLKNKLSARLTARNWLKNKTKFVQTNLFSEQSNNHPMYRKFK